ncbi:hypothetical protein V6Z12_D04G097300 [Gossypium hirsutum]
MGSETLIEVILAILLPPVGVFLRYGLGVFHFPFLFLFIYIYIYILVYDVDYKMMMGWQVEFWIDLVLTLVGYLPGIIYAIYVLVV